VWQIAEMYKEMNAMRFEEKVRVLIPPFNHRLIEGYPSFGTRPGETH
jgi:hypothetical protein